MATNRSRIVDRHIAALKSIEGKRVEAGWFESDRYIGEGGEPGVRVSEIARLNEYGGTINHPGGTKYITDAIVMRRREARFVGTRFVSNEFEGEHKVTAPHVITIPARPFMRLAHTTFRAAIRDLQVRLARKIVDGQITPEQALGQIGEAMVGHIMKSIKTGPWIRNAPSTVSRKGFDKPLIDTSHMFQTVNSKVY